MLALPVVSPVPRRRLIRHLRATRRRVALAATVALLAGGCPPAVAQEWPTRQIRLVVPFAPAGLVDSGVRALADKLGERLGQTVTVENRPGASGNIGTAQVAQSAPDGYTLVAAFDGTMVINPHVYRQMPFDVLKDLAHVTRLGETAPILVAANNVPVTSFRELLALSKEKPGTLFYGTSGTASSTHVTGELLKMRTGIDMTHVPYKGGGQALIDVAGGQIALVFTAIAGASQYVKQGRIRAIAIAGAQRDPALPDVPTFIESGVPGFEGASWFGISAPAKTPKAILDRLQREAAAALADPVVRQRYAALGVVPVGNTPEQFTEQVKTDLEKWGVVVKQAGIRME